jgi:radical SAM superfamily enzyme
MGGVKAGKGGERFCSEISQASEAAANRAEISQANQGAERAVRWSNCRAAEYFFQRTG